jgi:hypothetical protein
MGRKPKEDRTALLTHRLRLRVSESTIKRLESIAGSSNCRSIAAVARRILSSQKILMFTRDVSYEEPLQQLIDIRQELRSIGVNVNQITHSFHVSDTVNQKMFNALKVAEEYAKVNDKVDELVRLVGELGDKWLQR